MEDTGWTHAWLCVLFSCKKVGRSRKKNNFDVSPLELNKGQHVWKDKKKNGIVCFVLLLQNFCCVVEVGTPWHHITVHPLSQIPCLFVFAQRSSIRDKKSDRVYVHERDREWEGERERGRNIHTGSHKVSPLKKKLPTFLFLPPRRTSQKHPYLKPHYHDLTFLSMGICMDYMSSSMSVALEPHSAHGHSLVSLRVIHSF